ncbi:MAG TPA: hypothetical protein VGC30_05570 [Dokdonella sp.]
MKRFPLEPLSRVRDLRLEAAQRRVAECRDEVARAEQRREQARTARGKLVEQRRNHQRERERELSGTDALAPGRLARGERYRAWIDAEIVKCEAILASADAAVAQAEAKLAEELAALHRAQAKVDALQTFRQEWASGVQRERERQEEQAGEELHRASAGSTR